MIPPSGWICVGWLVIPLGMGILPKLLIIAVVSFPLMLLLYEFLSRHFRVVRFFFGMRPKKPSTTTASLREVRLIAAKLR